MKNLSNYINERLVLSKSKSSINDLSDIDLDNNQYIIRVGDFYCWYFLVDEFDDITKDAIDINDPWFEQVENCSFENQYDVYDFIKKLVDANEDYVVATQENIGNCVEISFELDGIQFEHDSVESLPNDIIIRKNK